MYVFFSVKYPVIHVLRISEEAEKPSMEKNNQQKNAKSTVNLAKPLSLHEPKVPFIYYVSTFLGVLDTPPSYISMFSNVSSVVEF